MICEPLEHEWEVEEVSGNKNIDSISSRTELWTMVGIYYLAHLMHYDVS